MLKEILIADFNRECTVTKIALDRMPETQLDFKPHEKSSSVLGLAAHIAAIHQFLPLFMETEVLDFATFKSVLAPATSKADVVANFTSQMERGVKALDATTDDQLLQNYTVKIGAHTVSTRTRFDEIQHLIRHIVHHRGQFSVYLRLFNIPVPKMYGRTADEQ